MQFDHKFITLKEKTSCLACPDFRPARRDPLLAILDSKAHSLILKKEFRVEEAESGTRELQQQKVNSYGIDHSYEDSPRGRVQTHEELFLQKDALREIRIGGTPEVEE